MNIVLNMQEAFSLIAGAKGVVEDFHRLEKGWKEIGIGPNTTGLPTIQLWYGERDDITCIGLGEALAEWLKERGFEVKLTAVRGQSHYSIVSATGKQIMQELIAP